MGNIHDIYNRPDLLDTYRQDKEKIERERQTELLRLQMELKNATSLVQAYMRENEALKASQVPDFFGISDGLKDGSKLSFSFSNGRFCADCSRGKDTFLVRAEEGSFIEVLKNIERRVSDSHSPKGDR